jgi:hypothetical protein
MINFTTTTDQEVRDLFEQDLATICRQACDLRHPLVAFKTSKIDNTRQFTAVFEERLNSEDFDVLNEELRAIWGADNVIANRNQHNTARFSVLLETELENK